MVHKVVKSGICLGFGGLAVLAGFVMLLGWPVYFMKQYKEIMILKPTSVAYNIWQDPKTPSYIEFFLFNISNTDELLVNSSDHYKLRPIVTEFGPYVYKEDIIKENITWHDNSTISFVNQRKLTFIQSMSKGSLTDHVTNVNPFLATLIYKHRWFSPIYYIYYEQEVQKRIDRLREIEEARQRNKERRDRYRGDVVFGPGAWQEELPEPLPKITDSYDDFKKEIHKEHKNIYTTATVSNWLFDGIQYPLSEKLPKLKFVKSSAWNFSKDLLTVPFKTFGWYFNRTEPKYEGTYLMNTGKRNFLEIGRIHKWRQSDRTTYRGRCGRVWGDEIWGPYWGEPRTIPIFNSDICSYWVFNKAVDKKKMGFKVMEYQLPENFYNNRHKESGDKCYCISNSRYNSENCLPRGALNITDCRGVLDNIGVHVIPLFASQPYFRGGDRIYRDNVRGMRNEWWRTKPYFGLEMFTGTTMYTKMTLQFNIMVTNMRGAQIGMNLPRNNTVMPMFWYRRTSTIAEDNLEMIKLVHRLRFGLPYAFLAIILLGLVLIICGILILSKGLIKFIQKLLKTKKRCCQLCRDITQLKGQNSEKSDWISTHNKLCKGDEIGDDTLEVVEKRTEESIGLIDDIRVRKIDEDRKIPPKNSWRSFDWSGEELSKPPTVPPHLKPLKKPRSYMPEKKVTRFVVPNQRWLYLLIVIILIAVISYIVNYIVSILTVWLYYTNLMKNKYKNATTTTAATFRRDG